MSGKSVAGILIAAGVGVVTGVGLAWAEATSSAQLKAKNRYEEQLELHKRVLQKASESYITNVLNEHLGKTNDGPVQSEEELDAPDTSDDSIKVGGEIVTEVEIAPDYVAAAVNYGDQSTFIRPEVDVAISYIEAEDYEDEDGRPKEQITCFPGGEEPIFRMEGEIVENWEELIGEHILVDFYKLVPPGADPVLYVRNHRRDEDYEVIMDTP